MLCALNRTESNKVRTKRASWFDAFSCSLAFPKRRQKEDKVEYDRRTEEYERITHRVYILGF